jgi:hypothetical protein
MLDDGSEYQTTYLLYMLRLHRIEFQPSPGRSVKVTQPLTDR